MIKKLFLIFIVLLTYNYCAEYSGIKFGIDTDIFKLLGKVNFNKYVQNKTLIKKDILFENKGFPSYKVHVTNATIADVKNPQVTVSSRSEGETKYLSIQLRNMEVKVQTSFNIEVLGLFKEQSINSPIQVVLDSVDSEFYFLNGNVKFTKLNVAIGKINLEFKNFFFNVIYKITKSLIIRMINSQVNTIHDKIESGLNNFITSQMLIDVGMGIGINATNVDRPTLVQFDKPDVSPTTTELKFLSEESAKTSTILEFGIHAALYPNLSPEFKPDLEGPVNMTYIQKTFNNDISLLISDYTTNTLLYMVQQTGALKYDFANDTNTLLPFNIDTESLGKVIPQISQKYPENKLVEIKLKVNAISNKQPKIITEDDGATFTFNFGMELNVFNGTEIWDDPNKELNLDITVHAKLQFLMKSQKLSLICFRTVIDKIEKKLDGFEIPDDALQAALDGVMNDLLKKFQPSMSDIDINKLIEDNLHIKVDNLILLTEEKYIVFSTNLSEL